MSFSTFSRQIDDYDALIFDPSACNVSEDQNQLDHQITTLKIIIFPKFIKELNAIQNLKYKRQLRKKHNSVTIFQNKNQQNLQCQSQYSQQKTFDQSSPLRQNRNKKTTFKLEESEYFRNQSYKGRKNSKTPKKRTEYIKNGNRIVGQFKNDQLHDDVEIYYKNGSIFRGHYELGIRIQGHFIFANGYEYRGGFFGDKFRGYGELKLPNGKIFCGDWQDQSLVGKTEIRYPTGQIYYGQVKNFKKHGKGYLFFNDGHKYVGQFNQGHITGNGEYFLNQKLIGRGDWVKGNLLQQEVNEQKGDENENESSQTDEEKQMGKNESILFEMS